MKMSLWDWCGWHTEKRSAPVVIPVSAAKMGEYREGAAMPDLMLLPGQTLYVTRYGDGSFDIELGS